MRLDIQDGRLRRRLFKKGRDALTTRVDALTAHVDALTARVDANTGELLEFRYERRAGACFSPMARRIRVLNRSALADLLDDALDDGHIIELQVVA